MSRVSEEGGYNPNEKFPYNGNSDVPKEPEVTEPYNPKRYPIKSYLGIITIAKREFFANLKSVRMLVLMLLFILAVLGGAYGIAGMSASTQTLPDVEVLGWAIVQDYDGSGAYNDIVVMISDREGNPRVDVQVEYLDEDDAVLFNSNTNQSGVVVINDILVSLFDINDNYFRVTFNNKIVSKVRTSYALEGFVKPAYVMANSLDIDDDNIEDDAIVMTLDGSGMPLGDVDVTISSSDFELTVTTKANGIIIYQNLLAGESRGFEGVMPRQYDVEARYLGSTSQNFFIIYMDDTSVSGLFELEGPNEIIYIIAIIFITMLGPIIAIALSFDSVTKEKIQKSMDFLLSRPMGRRGIIMGKFLGILLAITIPVTIINLLAVGLISSVTNKSPDGAFIGGFIIYTIIFIAIFILIQQIFSTLAKTTGTAILSGIAIWLIFNLFWSIISLAIGALMGLQFGSDDWISMNNQMSLINPGGAYPLALGYLLPTAEGTTVSALGIESWMPSVAMIIWFVVMFFLATEIFVRKTDS